MKDVIDFLQGKGVVPGAKKTVSEMRKLGNRELAQYHDYIQWMFPTTEASKQKPNSPVLSTDVMSRLATDLKFRGVIQDEILKNLRWYLSKRFGLELNKRSAVPELVEGNDFESKQKHWITKTPQGNQTEFMKISRILTCLKEVGLEDYAAAFVNELTRIQRENPTFISTETLQKWVSKSGVAQMAPPPPYSMVASAISSSTASTSMAPVAVSTASMQLAAPVAVSSASMQLAAPDVRPPMFAPPMMTSSYSAALAALNAVPVHGHQPLYPSLDPFVPVTATPSAPLTVSSFDMMSPTPSAPPQQFTSFIPQPAQPAFQAQRQNVAQSTTTVPRAPAAPPAALAFPMAPVTPPSSLFPAVPGHALSQQQQQPITPPGMALPTFM